MSGNNGTLAQEIASGFVYRRGILPTPTCFDRKTCKQTVPESTVTHPSGEAFTAGLRMLPYNGLLPTPVTQGLKICEDGKSVFMPHRMLPTSKAADGTGGEQHVSGRAITRPSGHTFSANLRDLAKSDLLPTPEANNYKSGHRNVSTRIERKPDQGWAVGLNDRATLGMLPTPRAGIVNGLDLYNPNIASRNNGNLEEAVSKLLLSGLISTPTITSRNGGTVKEREDGVSRRSKLNHLVAQDFGTTSQLSPLFVEQMMGFPTGWILLPFLRESPGTQEPSPSTVGEPKR